MSAREQESLYAVFTMDCVPPQSTRAVPGPSSWEDAQRSIESYAEGLNSEGLRATFFIAPEALKKLKGVACSLRSAGMEVGVLCHPQLSGYQSYLGSYGYDRQREIVRLARTAWQDAMGEQPTSFRAGFFSANDYTFQVLCMEGFMQGSCSLPGRIDPEQCSLWQKTCPFPHHADPLDRRILGTMEFFEVPVTSEADAKELLPAQTFTPPHLRIEDPSINEHAARLMEKLLDHVAAERAAVKSNVFVTQNSVGWGSDADPHLERLRNLISLLRDLADRRGMELMAATVGSLHDLAHERMPADIEGIE